jgi:predicted outer membrane repeat protein
MFASIFILAAIATANRNCVGTIAELSNVLKKLNPGNLVTVCPGIYTVGSTLEIRPYSNGAKVKCQEPGMCIFTKQNGNSRILLLNANDVLIDGFVFRDSQIENDVGGAVKIVGGNNFFANCQFINNKAQLGGAIYSTGLLNLIDTSFTQNIATVHGGAVYAVRKFLPTRSTGSFNLAQGCPNVYSVLQGKCLDFN